MKNILTENDIRALFSTIDLNEEEYVYFDFHAQRLAYTTNLVRDYCNEHSVLKLLDVGPHFLTRCIIEFVGAEISISTLGWEYPKLVPAELIDEHVTFNMIECENKTVVFNNRPFDLIVFSEIIEHLNISPDLVLGFMKKLLLNKGGGLLIETPNAAFLRNRIELLFGRNPFQLLHDDKKFKGHIREYTMNELEEYGGKHGFSIWRKEYFNYLLDPSSNKIKRIMETVIPSFRQGITVFFIS